ncbi:MAG TPA: chemotaxis response regulator protein-glutamate methylesterase [Myxococcales bacterium]|nr:chemotaxis response regulator protein-glutamate methylesterase [Myxococcales bacterium]
MLTVLVVDDSAVMRQVTAAVLSRDPDLRVVPAADPLIAMEKMSRARPDVILLDLEMPRMDGLTFLRKLMREDPIPVVVCSAMATPRAMAALDAGALDLVQKPQIGVREFLEESAVTLIEALRGAAEAGRRRRPRGAASNDRAQLLPSGPPPRLVAVGASTGGTEALQQILSALPEACPPLAVAQHMPAGFTAAFARRLDQVCAIEVKEAADGDALCPGRALIAPGGRHLAIDRYCGGYVARVVDGPLVSRHRPSVDVLFRSVAQAAGRDAIGVLLTGMGEDGAAGLKLMRERGADTIAQDEATSVVFGMPRAAIEKGAAARVVALPDIAAALQRRA